MWEELSEAGTERRKRRERGIGDGPAAEREEGKGRGGRKKGELVAYVVCWKGRGKGRGRKVKTRGEKRRWTGLRRRGKVCKREKRE